MKEKKIFAFIAIIAFLFNNFNIAFAQEQPSPPVSGQDSPGKISLDIKGMDIVDVLKIISQRSGFNIVAGVNVRGRVTIFLKDVDIWDAFEIILASNDLAYEKKGDIITVMTARDYETLYGKKFYDKTKLEIIKLIYAKAVDISRTLNQIKSNIGKIVVDESSNTLIIMDVPENLLQMKNAIANIDLPTQTKVYTLSFAEAEKIKSEISELLTKGVGTMRIDGRTNTVIVTDLTDNIKKIDNLIEAFDAKTKEVLIESRIVEITLNDDYYFGIDWDGLFSGIHGALSMNFDGISGDIITPGTTTGGAFKVGSLTSDAYSAVLEALRHMGKTKTLSTPRILALNNQEAKILVGTKEAYVTSTVTQGESTTQTAEQVTFVDVGVKLYVTPTINKDGFITMKIRPEVSTVGSTLTTSQGNVIPIVDTSEAETSVMIKDGVTIVIGGLMKDKVEKHQRKFPLLGDIPLLGGLFRKTSKETLKKELVIFLTPHLITGESIMDSFPSVKYPDLPFENFMPEKSYINIKRKQKETTAKETKVTEEEGIVGNEQTVTVQNYFNSVRDRIFKELSEQQWPESEAKEKEKIHLCFVLSDEGFLKGEPQIFGTTDRDFKNILIRGVIDSEPFGAFPDKLKKKEQAFDILITYEDP